MRRKLTGGLALFLLMQPLVGDAAQESGSAASTTDWSIETIRKRVDIGNATTLRIHHELGDIRIKAEDGTAVSTTAIAQRHIDDPRAPQIRSSIDGGILDLTLDFAHLEIEEHEAWAQRRIDIGLSVPKHLIMVVRTSDGLLEVRKAENAVSLKSSSGDITYEGFGDLEARTEKGSLRARFYDTTSMRLASLATTSGRIHVQLLVGAKGTLSMSTRGHITSDYSTLISRREGARLKQGEVKLGGKGPQIVIETIRGDIFIESLLAPEGTFPDD